MLVAFLVFVPGATDDDRFKHYAREMYPHCASHNVPIYIFGSELGQGPMAQRPANLFKVWPQRGPMECLLPEEFNPLIIELAEQHCG